jgi:hypothetical protein
MRQTPALCQPPARAGPAPRRLAPLSCSSLPRSRAAPAVRMRDALQRPSGAATAGLDWTSSGANRGAPQPAWIGPAQAPIGALPRPANDAHTGRSRPQSQGGSQPPRSNGQAFDEARNPVAVAGHRRCRASGRVRPRWDQAFPCYSPLGSAAASAGRASRPLAASSSLGPAVASSYRSEGGRVPLGSVETQAFKPSHRGQRDHNR